MKKFISLALIFTMLFALIPLSALNVGAETLTDSQGLTYTLSDDGTYYIVSDCDESVTTVVIPKTYNSLAVKEIGDYAFYVCFDLTSIEIPNSVTSIGASAFEECYALKFNKYENGLYLGNENNPYHVLYSVIDTDITSCEINKNAKVITDDAFKYCESLTSIEIPNSVTSIGESVLFGCSSIETITVADDNKYYYSEDNCLIETQTKTLIQGCKNSIIPNTVTSIGAHSFSSCKSLTSIEIPDSVTSIGDFAFSYCDGLISIEIPNSITSIGDSAFFMCNSLTSIEIPDSVTSIGEQAFVSCSSVETITVAEDNEYYYSEDNCLIETQTRTLIQGCKNSVIPNTVTIIGNYAFFMCNSLTCIEIPNSVTIIGNYAFFMCNGLTSIEIPNSVTGIGEWAFNYCEKLTDIYCEAESQPGGWNTGWLGGCNATVHWGCTFKDDESSSDNTLSGNKAQETGDINGNNTIDMTDYILLKRAYFGTYTFNDRQNKAGDINANGKIDMTDYILLKRIYFGTYTLKK